MKLSEYKRMIREASSDYEALQACEDAEQLYRTAAGRMFRMLIAGARMLK